MFITIYEVISALVITAVLGYIFSDYVAFPANPFDVKRFNWKAIRFAALLIAPAVIVHELFHKFVAMGFGFPATFHVYWAGLGIAVALKLFGAPFIILAPAYVSYPALATHFQSMLIAFAGPFANLLMWLGSDYWLKYRKMSRRTALALVITRQVNKFLFIFNMIPLPPLDGFSVLTGIIGTIS